MICSYSKCGKVIAGVAERSPRNAGETFCSMSCMLKHDVSNPKPAGRQVFMFDLQKFKQEAALRVAGLKEKEPPPMIFLKHNSVKDATKTCGAAVIVFDKKGLASVPKIHLEDVNKFCRGTMGSCFVIDEDEYNKIKYDLPTKVETVTPPKMVELNLAVVEEVHKELIIEEPIVDFVSADEGVQPRNDFLFGDEVKKEPDIVEVKTEKSPKKHTTNTIRTLGQSNVEKKKLAEELMFYTRRELCFILDHYKIPKRAVIKGQPKVVIAKTIADLDLDYEYALNFCKGL